MCDGDRVQGVMVIGCRCDGDRVQGVAEVMQYHPMCLSCCTILSSQISLMFILSAPRNQTFKNVL